MSSPLRPRLLLYSAFVALFASALLFSARPARADIAPPSMPPGSNLAPGTETTQVRMEVGTVILTVRKKPTGDDLGQADVQASFSMRN